MQPYFFGEIWNHTRLFLDWSLYYGEGCPGNKTDLNSHTSLTESSWILDCNFINIQDHEGTGSAISFSSSSPSNKLLVEHSIFNTCSTSYYHGGAIYIAEEGECVLSSVCGVKCYTGDGYYGQLCYVEVTAEDSCKNHIIDSSATSSQQTDTYDTLSHHKGNVSCKGVNVSNNKVYRYSGIFIEYPLKSTVSFSSFRNNNATDYVCIIFCYDELHEMSYSNVIENSHPAPNYGIIETRETSLEMNHCSIFGNCLAESGMVFYANSETSITCTNCSIPDDQKVKSSGSVTFDDEPTESFINYYEYLELDSCKAGLDSWGTLYPITPIPKQTPGKMPESKRFAWCCKNICQRGNIFLLCCLYTDPAKYF